MSNNKEPYLKLKRSLDEFTQIAISRFIRKPLRTLISRNPGASGRDGSFALMQRTRERIRQTKNEENIKKNINDLQP